MKSFQFLLVISFLLTSCAPHMTVTSEVTVTLTVMPQAENTKIIATPTAKEKTIEDMAQDVIDGKFTEADIMALVEQQRKELSIVAAAELNKQRGENPIIFNGEAYIDPNTGKMTSVEDGSTAAERTEVMFFARYVDDAGYTHIINEVGEDVRIDNSKGVNFQVFDTLEEVRAEITMPTTEKLGPEFGERAGLTVPEAIIVGLPGKPGVMMPVILLDKDLGEIYLSGGGKIPTQEVLIGENALVARKIIISIPNLRLYQEGTDLDLGSSGFLQEHYPIFEAIEEDAVYYFILRKDQQQNFSSTYPALGGNEATANYSGLIRSDLVFDVIDNKIQSRDFIWLDGMLFVKANK